MNRILRLAAVAALLASVAGGAAIGQTAATATATATDAATDADAAIAAQSTKFEEAFNRGDADGVAALYTEDAALFPPDAARIDGREAVKAFWAGGIGQGLGELDLTTIEVMADGGLATEVGMISLSAPAKGAGRTPIAGKYIVLWKRGEDGTWRLHRDIWNMGQ